MPPFVHSDGFHTISTIVIGSVWIFHGLYSKILDGIPRHRLIVRRVLGERCARPATTVIGILEVALGIWAMAGQERIACAVVQTAAIAGMNFVEILLASDLLVSAAGMVMLNIGFLSLVWHWALHGPKA